MESGVTAGFQLATLAGPLCDEPLWGVAFEVEARLNLGEGESAGGAINLGEELYGPLSGQVWSFGGVFCVWVCLEMGGQEWKESICCQIYWEVTKVTEVLL